MDDYIKREALRDALYDADAITMNGIKILNQFPAADVVPVVRCKDCKYAYYYNEEGCRGFVCNGYFQYADVESNDFCSYGEMRNNYCPNCGAKIDTVGER